MSWKAQIHEWLEHHREEGTRLLQSLVRMPSTQGNEQQAQMLIAGKLYDMNLEVELWEPDGELLAKHPYFYSPRSKFTGSPNVVGVLRGSGGGRSLLLNGHMDVVPEGDMKQWISPPYSGVVLDGMLYGRGASDMKGGNVALLLAIQAIRELGIGLKGDVIFQSVVEEESGGAGTLAAILKGYKADAALIPEPTNMRIFPKQQGSMWFRIHVKGRSAHGGTRYEGVSAIEKCMIVVSELLELERVRNARIDDPLFAGNPIPIPINIGTISGGNWPSSVPDIVTIEGRIGVAPEESMDAAKAELAAWLDRLQEQDEWFAVSPPRLEWFGARWVPGSVDTGHELIGVLTEQYEAVLGSKPAIEASPWGTDGGLLTVVGDTPCIVFGPGYTATAHYPNEHIALEDMFRAAEIIALTMLTWCGIEEEATK
ncbi:4-acetamidobutyryl-CoA deacetylase [Paenibacillus taihuensis]|uniref:Probable succinyl-diaminopimelate desuccinylase n=1 Tax=Paenibacillus taihuensis TaxID=1156355 RepID=A0A3D9QX38_9BACL|nr:peptidase [Paenibacillus taihuensis]REE68780.1 4-acetamidobutyryl-CoA deacetylase [Paenibacillus taihuensis]